MSLSERKTDANDHPREMLREALRELGTLSGELVAEQNALAASRIEREAKLKQEGDQAEWDVAERDRRGRTIVKKEHDTRLAEAEEAAVSGKKDVKDQYGKAVLAARRDADEQNSRIRKAMEEGEWLADSLLEGAESSARKNTKTAKEGEEKSTESLTELENGLVDVLHQYGMPHLLGEPAPEIPPVAETVDERHAQESLVKSMDATATLLHRLEGLALARAFVGTVPFVLAFVFIFLMGAVGQFTTDAKFPALERIGVFAGAASVFALLAGFGLKFLANRQVRAAYGPLRKTVEETRVWIATVHARALERIESDRQSAKARREMEVRSVREKHNPLLERVASGLKDKSAALDGELRARQGALEQERVNRIADAETGLTKRTEDLDQRKLTEDEGNRIAKEKRTAASEQSFLDGQAGLLRRWDEGLTRIAAATNVGQSVPGTGALDLKSVDWPHWRGPTEFPKGVRFGELAVNAAELVREPSETFRFGEVLPERFKVPAMLGFGEGAPSSAGSILIDFERPSRDAALSLLRATMARLLVSMPSGRVRLTMIDPVGLGETFAGFMHLADYDEQLTGARIWTDSEAIDRKLTDLTDHMETVIQKYLRNEFDTIDAYNAQAGELAEPYRFLVVADFPTGWSQESLRKLSSILASGARCGVHVLAARDARVSVEKRVLEDVRAGSTVIEMTPPTGTAAVADVHFGVRWRDNVFGKFEFTADAETDDATLTAMCQAVGEGARRANRVEVDVGAVLPKPGEKWTWSASEEFKVPVGRSGATRLQYVRLGKGVSQHALLAGKTGSGKSTLLHVLVTASALWYSPEEVEFYLIDFKKGVEFKAYVDGKLPHVKAVAVESDREFGLSVLQRLDAELTKRGEMFRRAGVQEINSYRKQNPKEVLPRVLLVVDEFQEFFVEDDKLAQEAASLLDRLVRQGRAFGMHVMLGSQTIGGSAGLPRATLGQMAVRVALQTSEADSTQILGESNTAARLLTRPGEAIYNDNGGLPEANSPFQVAWLPDSRRDAIMEEVAEEGRKKGWTYDAVVFEGNKPADMSENRELTKFIGGQQPNVPTMLLGEPVAIKPTTRVLLRRQPGSNVLMIGQQDEAALATMQAALLSMAGQKGARMLVLEGTMAESPLRGKLAGLTDRLKPATVEIVEYRDAEATIVKLHQELTTRQADPDGTYSPVVLSIYGLQRYRGLRKTGDDYSFSTSDEPKAVTADKALAELIREGPALGIHVVAWADTLAAVERVFDRGLMREFDHRVLFQMSANDSSSLIDSPAANRLGQYRALLFSEEQGIMEKFRPFAVV